MSSNDQPQSDTEQELNGTTSAPPPAEAQADFIGKAQKAFTDCLAQHGFDESCPTVTVAFVASAPVVIPSCEEDGTGPCHDFLSAFDMKKDSAVADVATLHGYSAPSLHRWSFENDAKPFPIAVAAETTKDFIIVNAFVAGINGGLQGNITPGVTLVKAEDEASSWVRFVLQALEGQTGKPPRAILHTSIPEASGSPTNGTVQYLPSEDEGAIRAREVSHFLTELRGASRRPATKYIVGYGSVTKLPVLQELETEDAFFMSLTALPSEKRSVTEEPPHPLVTYQPGKTLRQHSWLNPEPVKEPVADEAVYDIRTREPKVAGTSSLAVVVESGVSYFWCSCGHSKNQPFCDGSHVQVNEETGSTFAPLEFTPLETGEKYFCLCKKTASPPYCDGAHRQLDETKNEKVEETVEDEPTNDPVPEETETKDAEAEETETKEAEPEETSA